MEDSVDRMVAEWAERDPGLDVTALEVVGRLFRTAALGRRAVAAALQPLRLSYGDFDVLNTLRRRGDIEGVHPRVLAASSLITSGAMTVRVDRLVAAGWVERRPDPVDRRSILIRLTAGGERVAEQALDRVLAADADFLQPLSDRDRGRLIAGLKRLLLHHEAS